MIDRVTDININHRYETNRYLEIYHEALQVVHPQHEIMCEIAKWLVPIFCRTVPGSITLNDYPGHEIVLKKELCHNYLNVLKKVKPGLSRILGRRKKFYDSSRKKCENFIKSCNHNVNDSLFGFRKDVV